MKADWARGLALIKSAAPLRVILFYGNDTGLIQQRVAETIHTVIGPAPDPFRLSELDRPSAAELISEMASGTLSGGRRIVRLRGATDSVTAAVEAALQEPGDSVVVLEGGELQARSKLRRAVEAARDALAIACYQASERDLVTVISGFLVREGCEADRDALMYLVAQLGADFALTNRELEKLAIYSGDSKHISKDQVRAVAGDTAAFSIDDAISGALRGDVDMCLHALDTALAEGSTAVGVIRKMLFQLQRRYAGAASAPDFAPGTSGPRRAQPQDGMSSRDASTGAGTATDGALCSLLWRLERSCKRTGVPSELLCQDTLLTIARRMAEIRAHAD